MFTIALDMKLTIAFVSGGRIELAVEARAEASARVAAELRLVDESVPTVGNSMCGAPEPET